jgi:hypothetical protein
MNRAKSEMERLSDLLDESIEQLQVFAQNVASAEHAYRQSKARAWGHVCKTHEDGSKKLAAEIDAEIDGLTADLRYARDLADWSRQACLEAVRSRRQQLSAWQSWVAAERAEAEFVRTGQR